MKKSVVMAGLVVALLANAAWANEHGASSGTGVSTDDRASACSRAKSGADSSAPYGASVTGHSSCDCSSNKAGNSTMWTCTVDAYWEKK